MSARNLSAHTDTTISTWVGNCQWAVLIGIEDPSLVIAVQQECPHVLVIEAEQRLEEQKLRNWWDQDGGPQGSGVLMLCSPNPEPLLADTTSIFPDLKRLILWKESEDGAQPTIIGEVWTRHLEEAGFTHSPEEQGFWERNEDWRLQQALAGAREEAERLSTELDTLRQERDAFEQLVIQRSLQHEGLLANLQALQMQCDTVQADRDRILQQYSELQEQFTRQTNEIEAVGQQRDELQAQWRALQDERESLLTQYQGKTQECETLMAANTNLEAGNNALKADYEKLQRHQKELARLTKDSEQQLAMIRDLFVQVSTARINTKP